MPPARDEVKRCVLLAVAHLLAQCCRSPGPRPGKRTPSRRRLTRFLCARWRPDRRPRRTRARLPPPVGTVAPVDEVAIRRQRSLHAAFPGGRLERVWSAEDARRGAPLLVHQLDTATLRLDDEGALGRRVADIPDAPNIRA